MLDNFRTKYGKILNDIDNKLKRFANFKANVVIIETYSMDVNDFADLTSDEFVEGTWGSNQLVCGEDYHT